MLYDKRWDAKPETKPDVFSLESLIAWLETMPMDGEYCYHDGGGCLLHQYFTAQGVPVKWVGGYDFRLKGSRKYQALPDGFAFIAVDRPHTFGAAPPAPAVPSESRGGEK